MAVAGAGSRQTRRRRLRPAARLLRGAGRIAPTLKPRMQKLLIRAGYQYISRHNGWASGYTFMNHGYARLDEATSTSGPRAATPEQLSAQLYTKVASAVDLAGKDLLEVACGRGGGAAHVARTSLPRAVTGLDFAARAIDACRRAFPDPGLRFVLGDAADLPFAAQSFDAVLNVESAHCYPDVGRFFHEVHRVLCPHGVLLFADVLPGDDRRIREQFEAAGLAVVEEENLTVNVLRALELKEEHAVELIRRRVPIPLQRSAMEFAAVEGSEVRKALRSGGLQYRRFVLIKP